MGYANIVHVNIGHDDGLFIATSPDIPGFLVAHPDEAEVLNDIPNVIRVLLRRRTKKDVVVAWISTAKAEVQP